MTLSELKTIVDLLVEEGCGEIEASFNYADNLSWHFPEGDNAAYLIWSGYGGYLDNDGSIIHDPEFRKEFVLFLLENFK